MKNEAVTVTIGAKIFTDIGALLILALCIASASPLGVFNLAKLLTLLGWLIIYSVVVLVGFDWVGKEFFGVLVVKRETNFYLCC